MRILTFSIILFSVFSCSLPKAHNEDFQGKLIFKINSPINNPAATDSSNYQIVYLMDSMMRIDSYTSIGKQLYIKHIPKNKAYILMTLGDKKVAVQTIPDTASVLKKYSFKPKMGSDIIANQKAKRVMVTHNEQDTTFMVNYLPNISSKYSNALNGLPGFPIKYSIYSSGIWFTHELISLEQRPVNRDNFGIPSDYEIITLDQFMELIKEN